MKLITLVFLLFTQIAVAQERIYTLEFCQQEAQRNYPLGKGKALLDASLDLKIENLTTFWLPHLWMNGKMSWQSDVPGMSSSELNVPFAPKDQYSVTVDMEQLIFDGGRTKNRAGIEKASKAVELEGIEIQLYELRRRINIAYFTIMMMRKSKQILQHKYMVVNERLKEVASSVKSGLLLSSDQKLLQAELLLVEQQSLEIDAKEMTSMDILSLLMGHNISEEAKLQMPDLDIRIDKAMDRPEYLWFYQQREVLGARQELEQKSRLPVISAFGKVGYGNPGLKLLADEFNSFLIVGARIRWNLFDWKRSDREIKIMDIQKDLINSREESFTTNLNAEMKTQMRQISYMESLLVKDKALIPLLKDISESAASQLKSGVITSGDYLEELNREVQAKLNQQFHTILLEQAKAEYNRVVGRP